MDGQQQPNPLEQLILLNQIATAFDSIATNVSKTKSIDFGKVQSYEMVEVERLDDNGKPTSEVVQASLVTMANGLEIELSEQENAIFRPFWNMKCKVDNHKFAFATAIFNQMFPDEQK